MNTVFKFVKSYMWKPTFFQFTGATATVCLGFIFPAAIALRWVFLLI